MQNPKKELTEYFQQLLYRFLRIHSLMRQLSILSEWELKSDNPTEIVGEYFYELFRHSAGRMVILDLYNLISSDNQKSLIDWLALAKIHWKSLDLSALDIAKNTGVRTRISLKQQEYNAIIDEANENILKHHETINSLKGFRDKDIAHSDSSIFNNPTKFREQYPLSNIDISLLMEVVSQILHKQYLLIFHSDLTMEITSSNEIDNILRHTPLL